MFLYQWRTYRRGGGWRWWGRGRGWWWRCCQCSRTWQSPSHPPSQHLRTTSWLNLENKCCKNISRLIKIISVTYPRWPHGWGLTVWTILRWRVRSNTFYVGPWVWWWECSARSVIPAPVWGHRTVVSQSRELLSPTTRNYRVQESIYFNKCTIFKSKS